MQTLKKILHRRKDTGKVYWQSKLIGSKLNDWVKKQQAIYDKGDKSKHAKTFGELLKHKGRGIVLSLRHEIHEWKLATDGIRKIMRKEKPSKEELHAIKILAIHLAIVIGLTFLTEASIPFLQKLALGYVEHSLIVRGAHALTFAKAEFDDVEEVLLFFINGMSEYAQSYSA